MDNLKLVNRYIKLVKQMYSETNILQKMEAINKDAETRGWTRSLEKNTMDSTIKPMQLGKKQNRDFGKEEPAQNHFLPP